MLLGEHERRESGPEVRSSCSLSLAATAARTVADYYEAVVHAGADAKTAAKLGNDGSARDAKDHADGLRVPPGALCESDRTDSGRVRQPSSRKRCSPRSPSAAGSRATWPRR